MKLTRSSSLWNIVFLLTMAVYAAGLFVDIMEPDAAVYAQVSMEMHDRNDLLSIYHKGVDWLDKPHFPFWMSAFSYKIFGVNTFAYKLPAVLFVLLGAFYTFLFARRFYSAMHGWLAVLILITAEHIIISNQDVRAEPFLTGLVIMGLYHFALVAERLRGAAALRKPGARPTASGVTSREAENTNAATAASKNDPQHVTEVSTSSRKVVNTIAVQRRHEGGWKDLVPGSLALSCLIMTKGLFTIIPVAAGIGMVLLLSGSYRAILNWRWPVVIVLVLVFMFPSLYGYYRQFDMHPEKVVFGKTGVSGVEFFLWTSQWGRFTNTGPITGKGDISYFVHTMIWAFLPWSFMAFYALYRRTADFIKKRPQRELYTYFGFIVLFLIFSFSKFQLSFYLNPLFPLLSVITAAALLGMRKKTLKVFGTIHFVLAILLVFAMIALHYFFHDGGAHADTWVVVIAGTLSGFALFILSNNRLKRVLFAMALIALSINYYLNREFYPGLLRYQAESQVAHYMKAKNLDAQQLVFLGDVQSVADIILHRTTPIVPIDSITAGALLDKYVFTSPEGREKMDSLKTRYEVVTFFDDFHVTRITGRFINANSRSTELQQKFLLRVRE